MKESIEITATIMRIVWRITTLHNSLTARRFLLLLLLLWVLSLHVRCVCVQRPCCWKEKKKRVDRMRAWFPFFHVPPSTLFATTGSTHTHGITDGQNDSASDRNRQPVIVEIIITIIMIIYYYLSLFLQSVYSLQRFLIFCVFSP